MNEETIDVCAVLGNDIDILNKINVPVELSDQLIQPMKLVINDLLVVRESLMNYFKESAEKKMLSGESKDLVEQSADSVEN